MRPALVWAAALLALAAAARRADQDFEFEDADKETGERYSRKYIYDPHNPLCRSLVCKKREVCLLRDAFTALCATKKDILRKGDVIVPGPGAEEDEVFLEGARCAGCGGGGAQFLCGSDNRTYSSLCRLDLHNCVRRPAPPVTLACRGFCPWAPACDARGYYRPRQCHAALAVCWCVDAHGQELPASRTKGEPRCPPAHAAPPLDDDDDAGSGDQPF